jgi:hypothetical protein
MSRRVLAIAILSIAASAAQAKDVCIQIDSGTFAGSAIVLKKAKVGKGNVAPAQGYVARYSSATFSYFGAQPIHGATVVNVAGTDLALAIEIPPAAVSSGGSFNGSSSPSRLSMTCSLGADHALNVLDNCGAYLDGSFVSSHVIDCSDALRVP